MGHRISVSVDINETVDVDIDPSEVLPEIPTEDLIEELKQRDKVEFVPVDDVACAWEAVLAGDMQAAGLLIRQIVGNARVNEIERTAQTARKVTVMLRRSA